MLSGLLSAPVSARGSAPAANGLAPALAAIPGAPAPKTPCIHHAEMFPLPRAPPQPQTHPPTPRGSSRRAPCPSARHAPRARRTQHARRPRRRRPHRGRRPRNRRRRQPNPRPRPSHRAVTQIINLENRVVAGEPIEPRRAVHDPRLHNPRRDTLRKILSPLAPRRRPGAAAPPCAAASTPTSTTPSTSNSTTTFPSPTSPSPSPKATAFTSTSPPFRTNSSASRRPRRQGPDQARWHDELAPHTLARAPP